MIKLLTDFGIFIIVGLFVSTFITASIFVFYWDKYIIVEFISPFGRQKLCF